MAWSILNKKTHIIRSKKHPGALFIKVTESKDHFVCKVYSSKNGAEQPETARLIMGSMRLLKASQKVLKLLGCSGPLYPLLHDKERDMVKELQLALIDINVEDF